MSEDDMVERVARAIWEKDPVPLPAFKELSPERQEGFRRQARAAIEAMRDPTKEMLDAGWYEAHEEDALGTWQVMIDAALIRS